MMATLKAGFPKEELNGAQRIAAEAAKKGIGTKYLALSVIEVVAVETTKDNPKPEAKFKTVRVEISPDEHLDVLAALLERFTEERTGKTRLDLGFPDDLDLRAKGEGKPRASRSRKSPDQFAEQQELEAGPAKDAGDVVDAEVVTDDEQAARDAEFEAAAPDLNPEPDSPAAEEPVES